MGCVAESKTLFSGLGTPKAGFNQDLSKYGTSDGQSVHQWSNGFEGGSSTLAMTVTWYTRAKTLLGADGKRYSEAVESDCWYNNDYSWRIDGAGGSGTGSKTYDIQTIALHELGHTLGLSDLYGFRQGSQLSAKLGRSDHVGIRRRNLRLDLEQR